jgi:hypothetical protein
MRFCRVAPISRRLIDSARTADARRRACKHSSLPPRARVIRLRDSLSPLLFEGLHVRGRARLRSSFCADLGRPAACGPWRLGDFRLRAVSQRHFLVDPRNSSSYIIYLRAFSANRNFVWPATGGWVLDDRIQHCVSLACSPGEQICYGGTNNAGTDWGVGYSNSHGCTACCGVCDNSTYGTNLLD